MLATGMPAYAAGTLPAVKPSDFPPTTQPVNDTLTYYGAGDVYLNYFPNMPVGTSEEAVAWARVSQTGYSKVGFAKTGSWTSGGGGPRYSTYQDSINAYPYQPTLVVTQYVCPEGTNNGTPTWYSGHGMPNARNNPNECCTCGYRFDAAIQKCVLVNAASCLPACPENSTLTSSTTCTCNGPYVPDSSGTSCTQGQYTLSILQGPDPDVEPGTSKEIIVRVTNASNGPGSNVKVRLKVDVEATSGGHNHGGTNRNKGTLSGAACNPPENHCATAITNADGYTSFSFVAPEVSGKHTVTATCISHTCTGSPSEIVRVMVPGLILLPDSSLYALIGDNEKHRSNHYLTPEATTVLRNMAASYHFEDKFWQLKKARRGKMGQYTYIPSKLHVNDASLIWGGKFDVNGNWGTPHAGHRSGVVIDVRANSNTGAIPQSSFTNFQMMTASYGAKAPVHCTSNKTDGQNRKPPSCVGADGSQDSNRHFHILLLGVDQ